MQAPHFAQEKLGTDFNGLLLFLSKGESGVMTSTPAAPLDQVISLRLNRPSLNGSEKIDDIIE